MLLFMGIMIALLTNISATEVTLCNCTEADYIGILNFRDKAECHIGTKLQLNVMVNYKIFSAREPKLHFTGYVCSVWTKRVTMDEYFFGGRDTVKTTIPRNIYGSDCWRMHKTLDCYGNPMQRQGNIWTFEAEPEPVAKWMQTQTTDVQNCILEQTQLVQQCEGCPIKSPLGNLGNDSKVAEFSHNHATIVWDGDLVKHKQKCEVMEVDHGTGYQFNSTTDNLIRMYDPDRQLEYLAVQPDELPCNQDNLLQLTMDSNLFIRTERVPGSPLSDKSYQKRPDIYYDKKTAASTRPSKKKYAVQHTSNSRETS